MPVKTNHSAADTLPMHEISTPQQNPAVKKSRIGLIALTAVVIASVLFSIYQRSALNFSAGHMDEYDYLFVGKTLLQNLAWPTYTYIFGSNFSWYLFGWGDQWFGGLTGARLVATLFGLVSLYGVYSLTKAIWQCHKTALYATLLMAVNSGHIFTSKIATYDSISFALFALCLTPLFYGSGAGGSGARGSGAGGSSTVGSVMSRRAQTSYLIVGTLLLLAAIQAKYTTLAYVPFIGLVLLCCSVRAAAIFSVITLTGSAIYLSFHWADLNILYDVQINGVHGANATYKAIISRTLNSTWILFLPAVFALLHARSNRKYNRRPYYTIAWLLFLATPFFFYHLQSRNLISLYKHLNHANIFLAIATAWLVNLIATAKPWQASRIFQYRLPILAFMALAYLAVNVSQLKAIQQGYPNVQPVIAHLTSLNEEHTQANGKILSEEPYLFRYLNFDQMDQNDIKETTWLDNNHDGVYSQQDVQDAIWDRKFELVFLTDAIHPELNNTLREILEQRGYHIEFEQPYELSSVMTTHVNGNLRLYRLGQQFVSASP